MRKIFFTILTIFLCFSAYSQETKESLFNARLSYSAGIGQNFFGNRIGVDCDKIINDDVAVRFGIATSDLFFNNRNLCLEDKAPYSAKGKQISLNAAMDYKVSNKLLFSFSAFYSNMNVWTNNANLGQSVFYSAAFNASFRYVFKENSFIDVSFTFVDTNNPFLLHYPYCHYYCDWNRNGFTSFWLP